MKEASDIIELNVGGSMFSSRRSTMSQYPPSALACMIPASSLSSPVFIDRDPKLFEEVLDILRNGLEYEPPEDERMIRRLVKELNFFQIPIPPSIKASCTSLSSPCMSRIYIAGGSSEVHLQRASALVWSYSPLFNGWSSVDDLPHPQSSLSLATLGNQLFALGGKDRWGNESCEVSTLDLSDPSASWTSSSLKEQDSFRGVRHMSTPRHSFTAATVSSRIYAIGHGRACPEGRDTVEFFDPGSLSWWSAPPLSYSPLHHASCSWPGSCGEPGSPAGVVGDHSSVIITSGGYSFGEGSSVGSFSSFAPHLVMLDVRSREGWTKLGSDQCNRGRAKHGIAALDGRIYLVGGERETKDPCDSHVDCFDMRAGRWADDHAPPLPVPLASLAVTAIGGQLVSLGGMSSSHSDESRVHESVYCWRPQHHESNSDGGVTSSWSLARHMKVPLHSISAVSFHS